MELLEEAGLPPVCAALAVEEDADKQLGTVLAEAVQVTRHQRPPGKVGSCVLRRACGLQAGMSCSAPL